MLSKRLADIRPGTVISVVLLIVFAGVLRVFYGPTLEIPFSFLGSEYEVSPLWRWGVPVLAGFGAMFANWVFVERLQILKRNSYLAFLFGAMMVTVNHLYVATLAILAVIWFASTARLQSSKRVYADYLDIGLITGVMSLFQLRLALLLVLSWFISLAYGRLRARGILIGVWGVVMIHILVATGYFLSGAWDSYISYFEWSGFTFDLPPNWLWPWLAATFLYWILSLGNYITALTRANVLKRQSLTALLTFQLGVVLLDVFALWSDAHLLAFMPIGSLIFVANDIQYRQKKWWKEVELWLFIASFASVFFII